MRTREFSLRKDAAWAGITAIFPLSLAALPFGIVYGVAVVNSPTITRGVGFFASVAVFAGASQLAALELLDRGAPLVVVVGTALVVNLRMVMYSGALAHAFSEFPRGLRIPLAHLTTDQNAIISLRYFNTERDAHRRLSFWIGAGVYFWLVWLVGTSVGLVLGDALPTAWRLDFAVPLMFTGLLVPTVKDVPTVIAAGVGGGVTLLARGAPYSSGLLIGALVGVIVAATAARFVSPTGRDAQPPPGGADRGSIPDGHVEGRSGRELRADNYTCALDSDGEDGAELDGSGAPR